MASALPYLASNKNIGTLFGKIASAKVPEKFSQTFLSQTIGLKSTNDRMLIPLLRTLGFLDASGSPTTAYRQLKNAESAKGAIASAVRQAYKPLFDSDEEAHKLAPEKLKGLVAQVAGTDDSMTARIASTFNSLVKLGDFDASMVEDKADAEDDEDVPAASKKPKEAAASQGDGKRLRPEFHYNIQVHLPSNATEEVYLNIFNAIRKVFQ